MSNLYIINKPINWTSNDVLKKIKKELNLKKIGHGGTLDPLATGVLVIGINEGTKLLNNQLNATKQYLTTITFGYETNTLDLEGIIINESNNIPKESDIIKQLDKFKNEQYWQTPPTFSAIKINGVPAYKYARKNIEINIEPKLVNLYDYQIISYCNQQLTIQIDVSKGFYVRSFARDISHALNTYGTITKLVRTKSGDYSLNNAYTIEEFICEFKK